MDPPGYQVRERPLRDDPLRFQEFARLTGALALDRREESIEISEDAPVRVRFAGVLGDLVAGLLGSESFKDLFSVVLFDWTDATKEPRREVEAWGNLNGSLLGVGVSASRTGAGRIELPNILLNQVGARGQYRVDMSFELVEFA